MNIKTYVPQSQADALLSRFDLIDALAFALWDEENYPFVPTQVRVVSSRDEDDKIQTLALVTGLDLNGPDKQTRRRVYDPSMTWRAPEWLQRMVTINREAFMDRFPLTPLEG